jgi:hypothetical protein
MQGMIPAGREHGGAPDGKGCSSCSMNGPRGSRSCFCWKKEASNDWISMTLSAIPFELKILRRDASKEKRKEWRWEIISSSFVQRNKSIVSLTNWVI